MPTFLKHVILIIGILILSAVASVLWNARPYQARAVEFWGDIYKPNTDESSVWAFPYTFLIADGGPSINPWIVGCQSEFRLPVVPMRFTEDGQEIEVLCGGFFEPIRVQNQLIADLDKIDRDALVRIRDELAMPVVGR